MATLPGQRTGIPFARAAWCQPYPQYWLGGSAAFPGTPPYLAFFRAVLSVTNGQGG